MMTDIGTLPGDTNAEAYDINDSGQVVGNSWVTLQSSRGFLYSGGQMVDVTTLIGGVSRATAERINDSGQIVGEALFPDGHWGLYLYGSGQLKDLGSLGGGAGVGGMNNVGQVVGTSYNADGKPHAFMYDGQKMIDLGTLPDPTVSQSSANAVNSFGQVVGYSWTNGGNHAFLHSNGAMVDLNDLIDPALGWTLDAAGAINDSGDIECLAFNYSTQATRVFLLTPTPEPTTATLILFGTIAMIRRNNRRS
jgi:probable HAF family extracellular repeat protein